MKTRTVLVVFAVLIAMWASLPGQIKIKSGHG